MEPAEQPPPAKAPQSDAFIAALLLDRSGPGRWRHGAREIEVDRFLAFAYSRGLSLAGLERRVDLVVNDLGGRRADPPTRLESSASKDRARRLPIYHLPDNADGPAIRQTGRRSRPARTRARTGPA